MRQRVKLYLNVELELALAVIKKVSRNTLGVLGTELSEIMGYQSIKGKHLHQQT